MTERTSLLLAINVNDAISAKYDAVVGIDLGTSRSGFTYAYTSDGDVRNYTGWPRAPYLTTKTPSDCVYDKSGHICFGWDAKRQFAALSSAGNLGHPNLIRHAKLRILNDEPVIPGTDKLSALTVMADLLRELKDKAIGFLSPKHSALQALRILWVVTIPAGWGDREKSRYREIAQKAGLISTAESDQERLILLAEPEAAMVYCQAKVQHELDQLKLIGRRFMVIDAGGGTVDVASYEVREGNRLAQLSASQADTCGSELVSGALEENFMSIFQSTVARLLADDRLAHIWHDQLNKLEAFKCGYSPRNDSTLYLSYEAAFYKEAVKDDAKSHDLQRLGAVQGGDDSRVYFSHSQIASFFAPACEKAAAVAHAVAANAVADGKGRLDAIVLVGGFSESLMFQQSMRDALREFVDSPDDFITPPAPADAVVIGATAYGLNPEVIHSRRSRLTYGASCLKPFIEGQDDKRRLVRHERTGEPYCKGCVDVFVHANQEVPVDEAVVRVYTVMKATQDNASIELFSTNRTDVRYTDDTGVHKYPGEIVIPMPGYGFDRSVTVAMYFGKTEVELVVTNPATNENKTLRVRFSGQYSG